MQYSDDLDVNENLNVNFAFPFCRRIKKGSVFTFCKNISSITTDEQSSGFSLFDQQSTEHDVNESVLLSLVFGTLKKSFPLFFEHTGTSTADSTHKSLLLNTPLENVSVTQTQVTFSTKICW